MLLPPDISRDELLSYVRPPYPNGMFPLGSGWRIVLYAILALIAISVLIRYSPGTKRRREAFAVFNASRRSFANGGDITMLASELSVLMRRVALYRFGREKTAGLNGKDWILFLKQTGADLNEEDERLLASTAYAPASSCDDNAGGKHLLRSVQKWLERNL